MTRLDRFLVRALGVLVALVLGSTPVALALAVRELAQIRTIVLADHAVNVAANEILVDQVDQAIGYVIATSRLDSVVRVDLKHREKFTRLKKQIQEYSRWLKTQTERGKRENQAQGDPGNATSISRRPGAPAGAESPAP